MTEGSKVYINAADEDTLYYAVNYYLENGLTVIDNVVSSKKDFTKGVIESNWDTNDTCSFVRLHVGGKSIMVCGDICNDVNTQRFHSELYSADYLKSDILQVSHHGRNLLKTIYDACDPEYALIPNAYENIISNSNLISYYNKMVDKDTLYYAGEYTTPFEITNGEITVKKIPRYDHPDMILE